MMDLTALKAEFPRDAVHWRAQSVRKDGTAAKALAYIDARDVMDRLDEVCGPENWQDGYAVGVNGTMICRIGINCAPDPQRHEADWIWKADGAGKTDVEGEKGQISDAFKRAAVKWGIGRYLYAMPTPWVPCKSWQKGTKQNGDPIWVWEGWNEDPWKHVKAPKAKPSAQAPKAADKPPQGQQQANGAERRQTVGEFIDEHIKAMNECFSTTALAELQNDDAKLLAWMKDIHPEQHTRLQGLARQRHDELLAMEAVK